MSIRNEQTSLRQQTPSPAATAGAAWRWLDGAWRWLVDARLLALLSVLLLALVLLGIALPQMPGQLRSEPLAAERWLSTTAAAYGAPGGVLRALGGFDVLRSPFFVLLLAALILVLLVQLADAVRVALAMRRLSARLDDASPAGGEALSLLMPHPVERWRGAVTLAPTTVIAVCESSVQAWAGRIERRMLRVPPAPSQLEFLPSVAADTPGVIVEERLLGVSGLTESALRPLLPLGLMLALLVAAWYSVAGHSFTPAPLLPGERVSDAVLGLSAEYQLRVSSSGVLGPVLKVTHGGVEQTLPLQPGRVTLENVNVAIQPGAPALVVYTLDERALLARPGQASRMAMMGVGFPDPGSEEVLVLPESGIGVRIVRQDSGAPGAADDSFVVEVFQGDSEAPVQRFPISRSEVRRIESAAGEIVLGFAPIAMFQLQAYTTPGVWLLIPALLAAVAGAYGFRRRLAFLLAQVGPWPLDRSVVVLQSDRPGAVDEIRRSLEAPSLPGGSGAAPSNG